MAIPDFQSFMLPLLRFASDGKEHTLQEARELLSKEFKLSSEDVEELLPSGRQTTFANRVAWAKGYLNQAGLLDSPRRGVFQITKRGEDVFKNPPPQINRKFLEQFDEFQRFRQTRRKDEKTADDTDNSEVSTPEEALEQAYQHLRDELASLLLDIIKKNSSDFFEKLVVNLLVKMGYGGSIKDAGKATKKTGDEGIDGIIKEDRLGLDIIYLQAKRWENPVGRPEIQKFVGALHGQRAKKGIFITTSRFSAEAVEYAQNIDPKIVLIDGDYLVQLMLDHNLGVSPIATYEIKKIDSDFFVED